MHYLALGRYSPQGAAGVAKDSLTSRKQVVEGLAEAGGSRLVGMWGVQSGDFDFVLLFEGDMPPALGAANRLQMGLDHLAEVVTYVLVETVDVDEALRTYTTVTRAPGAE